MPTTGKSIKSLKDADKEKAEAYDQGYQSWLQSLPDDLRIQTQVNNQLAERDGK